MEEQDLSSANQTALNVPQGGGHVVLQSLEQLGLFFLEKLQDEGFAQSKTSIASQLDISRITANYESFLELRSTFRPSNLTNQVA